MDKDKKKLNEGLKYKAEYARTDRSTCQFCFHGILENSLRLAAYSQSEKFDGLEAKNYHCGCFFAIHQPSELGHIAHIDSLRWKDKEIIKNKIENLTKLFSFCKENENKQIRSDKLQTKVNFESSDGMCYGCKSIIYKEDRIRTVVYQDRDQWFHIECFTRLWKTFGSDYEKFLENLNLNNIPTKSDSEKFDEVDYGQEKEKTKTENQDDEVLHENDCKKQNEKFYIYWDLLEQLKISELKKLSHFNGQRIKSFGKNDLLDLLADSMTFGALLPCSQCEEGRQFIYKTGAGYECHGTLGMVKCINIEKNPKRTTFKVPTELGDKFPFLKHYNEEVGVRLIPKDVTPCTVDGIPQGTISLSTRVTLEKKNHNLKRQRETLDGETETLCEIENNEDTMELAENLDTPPPLALSNTDECFNRNAPKVRRRENLEDSKTFQEIQELQQLKRKHVVNINSGLAEVAHVYVDNGVAYSAVLNRTDVQINKNSYYILQILVSDEFGFSNKDAWLFRGFGRTGTNIGDNRRKRLPIEEAVKEYKKSFLEKTGNNFEDYIAGKFTKKPGCRIPMDIDHSDAEKLMKTLIYSHLQPEIQDLIKMISNEDIMQNVILSFKLDIKKLPLGKLSKKQIKEAYGVLLKLLEDNENVSKRMVIEASNRFYTLIPNDFGMQDSPPLLDNMEIIQLKLNMLDTLYKMKISYELLYDPDGNLHPIDAIYMKLNTLISVLDRNTEMFKLIQKYVDSTHGKTHSNYELRINKVFGLEKESEKERFKDCHNRKLLWHGSRVSNFGCILSKGLLIAPPEAPSTGYMFGKGIYFADRVSKSANYCYTTQESPFGLLLLCEVALGNMYERTQADAIEKLPPGKDSVKGVGSIVPDPNESVTTSEGVEIPLGKGIETNIQRKLLYNEYVVYDIAQVKMKYLVEMEFIYLE